jgi:RimJ/RimL family protein N-acetyltransferase
MAATGGVAVQPSRRVAWILVNPMSELMSILPSAAILGSLAAIALLLTFGRDWAAENRLRTRRAVRIAAVAVLFQATHFGEELLTGFYERFPALFGLGPMMLGFFVLFNLAWLAIWSVCVWGLRARRKAALFPLWFLSLGCIANGVAHPSLSAYVGGYFPGLATSPVVGLLGVVLLRRLLLITQAAGSSTPATRSMPSRKQPELTTQRLLLRPFVLADAWDVQRLAGAWEIADTTLNIPYPYVDGVAEGWIASHALRFNEGTLAAFAVVDRREAVLVGAVGLTIDPEHSRGELGYWIGVPFWRQGYATETVRAVMNFGFKELRLNRIQGRHLVRNPASGRVMQKVGMTYEGTLRKSIRKWEVYEDVAMYSALAEEWDYERSGA